MISRTYGTANGCYHYRPYMYCRSASRPITYILMNIQNEVCVGLHITQQVIVCIFTHGHEVNRPIWLYYYIHCLCMTCVYKYIYTPRARTHTHTSALPHTLAFNYVMPPLLE